MGSSILLSLLFLSFPYCIFHQSSIFVAADTNLIQKTCKNTKYYDLCVSTLKSNATSTKVDAKGLAMIMVGAGMANATATSSYLSSQLQGTRNNDMNLKKVLKECADKYTYAGDALQASVHDLATEEYDYASMHVTGAGDYPNACRNAFRRYPGMVYPPEIGRREKGLKQICDVLLGIIENVLYIGE